MQLPVNFACELARGLARWLCHLANLALIWFVRLFSFFRCKL